MQVKETARASTAVLTGYSAKGLPLHVVPRHLGSRTGQQPSAFVSLPTNHFKLAANTITRCLRHSSMSEADFMGTEEIRLRNAVNASSSGHRAISVLTQLTRAHSKCIRSRHARRQLTARHVQGMRQQLEHVIHILQTNEGTHLSARDLGQLAQSSRRLKDIVEAIPSLEPQQEALCNSVVSAALRSPTMAEADMYLWGTLLHGVVSSNSGTQYVVTQDIHALFDHVAQHLPTVPLHAVQPAMLRSSACSRLMWAIAHANYHGDGLMPLVDYVFLSALPSGFMHHAPISHWSRMFDSAARLQMSPTHLLPLLHEGLPAMSEFLEHKEHLSPGAVCATCWAVAVCDLSKLQPSPGSTTKISNTDVTRWVDAIRSWIKDGGLQDASDLHLSQIRWAAHQLAVDLPVPGNTSNTAMAELTTSGAGSTNGVVAHA